MSLPTKNIIQFVKPLRHSWHIHFKTYTRVILLLSFKIISPFFPSQIFFFFSISPEHTWVQARQCPSVPYLEMGFHLIYCAGDVDRENEITRSWVLVLPGEEGWGRGSAGKRKSLVIRLRETCNGCYRIVFKITVAENERISI